MTGPPRLGPFELGAPLGRGGMGEVWTAVHRSRAGERPVAIKVLGIERARSERFQRAFLSEVQAVAGLNHRNIVAVYDHGSVPEDVEAATEGRLVAGTPYLVMELARGRPLNEIAGKVNWTELRAVLQQLLAALAHSHARGVIHADIKPANALLDRDTGVLKLLDFGLAHALTRLSPLRAGEEGKVLGTPNYMPPEQIEGRPRDLGPWTDLYAIGCLAYTLATGRPPFSQRGKRALREIMAAQLFQPPPPLKPRLAVPDGFAEWTARLLEKLPRRRFQRAADAAWALDQLVGPPLRGAVGGPLPAAVANERTVPFDPAAHGTDSGDDPTVPTLDGEGRAARTVTPLVPDASPGLPRRRRGPQEDRQARVVPPFPLQWRDDDGADRRLHLLGAGLGLYGVRAIPMVDREEERDTLWRILRRCNDEGRGQAVVLRGPAGCGKSRLARWIAERSHEVGGATVLSATHSPVAGPHEGVRPMVARHLGCLGLGREEVLERVTHLLADLPGVPKDEEEALTELLVPATDVQRAFGLRAIRFGSPRERYVLVERLLRRLAVERPVLLWLDDVQWGRDALGLARHLLDRQADAPFPLLLVLTARQEALLGRPDELAALDALAASPLSLRLDVGPFEPEPARELVRELRGLAGDLAQEVKERTGGNAMFAVQLVGDWVQRGVLEAGPAGFVLREGAQAELPDDLHAHWTELLNRFLAGRPRADGHALELAAVLGGEVAPDEWRAACELADLHPSPDLAAALVSRALARWSGDEGAWTLAHGMLRESLFRRARERGRWASHHGAAAALLADQPGAGVAARRGRHLTEAEAWGEALAPLLQGARELRHSGDYAEARGLLDLRERCIAAHDEALDGPRAEGCVARAELHRLTGQRGEAARMAQRGAELAERAGQNSVLAAAWQELARSAVREGRLEAGVALLNDAQARFRQIGDQHGEAVTAVTIGSALRRQGRLDEARQHLRYGLGLLQARHDPFQIGNAYAALTQVALFAGQLPEAEAHARRGLRIALDGGYRALSTHLYNSLGEVARLRGDLDTAETAYRSAIRGHEAIGSATTIPECNLALVLVERSRFRQARSILTGLLPRLQASRRRGLEAVVRACLLPCVADAADWAAWDDHLSSASALLADSGFVEAEIPRVATLGAKLARESGQPERAHAALDVALRQWTQLGRDEEASKVKRLLALPRR